MLQGKVNQKHLIYVLCFPQLCFAFPVGPVRQSPYFGESQRWWWGAALPALTLLTLLKVSPKATAALRCNSKQLLPGKRGVTGF